jgi:hypothetical protein
VLVGGYYWVFWTSTRKFGTHSTDAPADAIGGEATYGSVVADAYKKRLWVSAIKPRLEAGGEFATSDLTDLSSPAFYLEGQSETGNVRAFAALNPCKPTGQSCTTGIDCCTGFCDIKDGAAMGECIAPQTCAKENERCAKDSDCCHVDAGTQPLCVGGYCGSIVF